MQYLMINPQHWINTKYIDDIYVSGRETDCQILIHLQSMVDTDPLIVYLQFRSAESAHETAFAKAERALTQLINKLTDPGIAIIARS